MDPQKWLDKMLKEKGLSKLQVLCVMGVNMVCVVFVIFMLCASWCRVYNLVMPANELRISSMFDFIFAQF